MIRSSKRPSVRPRFESLEDRTVPAVSMTVTDSELHVSFLAGVTGENLTVARETITNIPRVSIFSNGARIGTFNSSQVSRLRFTGGPLADRFFNNTNLPSFQNGGSGNDTLVGGTGSDTLRGNLGNDSLNGGGGFDQTFEISDTNFSLQALNASSDQLISPHTGTDTLTAMFRAKLVGGTGNNRFDTSLYTKQAELDGGEGLDLFLLGNNRSPVTIQGGNGEDIVRLTASSLRHVPTGLGSVLVKPNAVVLADSVEAIDIIGTNGPDQIDMSGYNGTATILGFNGNDVLKGGNGNDVVQGGNDNDILLESPGEDTLDGGAGSNALSGIKDTRLSPSDLNATGELAVILREQFDQTTQTTKKFLEVVGPSGGGFRLEGDWQSSLLANGGEQFKVTSGNVILLDLMGTGVDLPIPVTATNPLVFNTKSDIVANFGFVADKANPLGQGTQKDVSWNGGLGLLNTAPGSPLSFLRDDYGLDFSLPGVSLGLALGSQLEHLGVPVNPGLPYLFFNLGGGSASFGGLSVTPSGGATLAVIVDPSDSIYLASSIPIGFEIGISNNGYIPFKAEQSLLGNPSVYGNLIAGAEFDLGFVPVTLNGQVVLDFDANDDGFALGLTPATLNSLVNGQLTLEQFAGTLQDVNYGFNGSAAIGYSKAGFNFSLKLAEVSAAASASGFAFHAAQVDPFDGTPLAPFSPIGDFDLQGRISPTGDFDLNLHTTGGGLIGLVVPSALDINLNNSGIRIDATVRDVLGFGNVALHGDVQFNGGFNLTGSVNANIDIREPFFNTTLLQANIHAAASLSKPANGAPTFSAGLTIDPLNVGVEGVLDFDGSLQGSLTVGPGGFAASGSVNGTINVLGNPVATISPGFSLSGNGEARVKLADGLEISFNLNTGSQLPETSITPTARAGDLVRLRGRISEVNSHDHFILNVNWGDGTTSQYTYPPGSNGRMITVAHRYANPSPDGQPYPVTLSWSDQLGAGSSTELTVRVTSAATRRIVQRIDDITGDGMSELVLIDIGTNGKRTIRMLDGATDRPLLKFGVSKTFPSQGKVLTMKHNKKPVQVQSTPLPNGQYSISLTDVENGLVLADFSV